METESHNSLVPVHLNIKDEDSNNHVFINRVVKMRALYIFTIATRIHPKFFKYKSYRQPERLANSHLELVKMQKMNISKHIRNTH